MIKFNAYQFRKVYIEDRIFIHKDLEIKAGYLNINGLIDGEHGQYLNEDKNLLNLHILLLSETKLDSGTTTTKVEEVLNKWNIIHREDACDGLKHMGLLLVCPKTSTTMTILESLRYQKVERNKKLQIQGLVVRFSNQLKIGFLYSRSTMTEIGVISTNKAFKECNALMGNGKF